MMILGIDPGRSGGFCLQCDDGDTMQPYKQPETDADILELIESLSWHALCKGHKLTAVIEKVHAMPKQGVTSTFTFGRNFGFLHGVLTALKIPVIEVTPQRWQKELGCMSKGDKNVTKQKAQQLFPDHKFTHATADACLIAYWGVLQSKQGKL
jgi:Holliday junction resolvasome RuvABC endonuclease subunit